jgi:hypothetical protein
VAGEFQSDALHLTLTFPQGWRIVPYGDGTTTPNAKFLRGSDVTPDEILLVRIGATPLVDPPSPDRALQTSEHVFADEISRHADAQRVGSCELLAGTEIVRCVARSTAPLARTLIDYDWLIDGRHAGMRMMSASNDIAVVCAEADAIATSAH